MLAVAILAAGKGTRMKTDLPKVLQQLCGRSLVERVLESAATIAPNRQLVIVGHKKEIVESALAHIPSLEFVTQSPQLGTGHAIQQLLEPLKDFTGDLVVLTGDTPLLRPETIQNLVSVHQQRQASATVLTAQLPDPTGYGRVFCNQDFVIERIIEHKDCTEPQRLNQRVSSGVYCFNWQELAIALPKLTSNNAQKEYYLTEVFDYLETVIALDAVDFEESFGINDRLQLAHAHQVIQSRTKERWMRAGVTMILPETITIDDTVELDVDVIIEPQTHLRGKTKILAGATIGPNSFITNSTIGHNCQVSYSVIEDSEIGADSKIGPFSRIRGASVVGDRCRIGNFVELKQAKVGSKTNAAHLSYLGDVTLGSQVNVGAGTITANYDGFAKHQTVIGDRTKIGSNSVLVAPIQIGDNVNIGAGSVVTKDVEANSLVIARAPQVVKPDYYDAQGKKKNPS
ncbi:UDP-N-acetylglucosamine diphosphorylase/glucosamine-1-phosphate N-acetyltransferase [Synechococcus sp. PCC 7502]|uniref:bifunctional UDP-N-acetylglucosamine diphosphorylase/glucosamine-1-phosphate N-acetyltransferase GlmU n=1 Tax=Synechococcus sp. PCC 7502 TaxID=1173263 RepID=UPI00029FDC19|nr:bifunctional UDP-N-acetylglucosamine diphosphorylase/glucosamine-1-phosphate N-acetyltransferase GlmU [Synechococcus sp. PCC 7502]AFY74605.1 UDP-N-acetylglucosamine diphosphorylase/glucosamine-1-phosphate N-acetyltransferase [Synechococcus sp. PCC 7502]